MALLPNMVLVVSQFNHDDIPLEGFGVTCNNEPAGKSLRGILHCSALSP
jgi:hypothetical protein